MKFAKESPEAAFAARAAVVQCQLRVGIHFVVPKDLRF